MKEYLAVLEHAGDDTWSAYVPDLPGCTSFGPSRREVARNVRKAIGEHIAALQATGQEVPDPTSLPEIVTLA
jgi:predicted RNase H-like HicB family nuclease